MATLFETAQAYEPPQTRNIADLDVVKTDLEVEEKEFVREDGTKFQVKVINVKGFDYRVPTSVFKSLKAMKEDKPNLKLFKVKKTGEGLKTVYTVIPLD